MNKDKTFVVYQHTKPNGEIFYIGIGSIKRSKCRWNRSKYWNRIVNKYGYKITILHYVLTECEAIALEISLISKYGRSDLGLGTLCNHTNGGEGVKGYKHTEEAKRKIGKASKGIPRSEETILKISDANKGKIRTDEAKKNMSIAQKGKVLSGETKDKMAKNRVNCKVLLDPQTGVFYDSISDAARIFGISDEALRCHLNKPHLNYKTNLIIV